MPISHGSRSTDEVYWALLSEHRFVSLRVSTQADFGQRGCIVPESKAAVKQIPKSLILQGKFAATVDMPMESEAL